MRLGQTSVIHFLSKLIASSLGFAATVYIAQLLGAGVLGIYSLATAVVSWLLVLGSMGIKSGIQKRVSEQREPSEYAIAGTIIMFLFLILICTLVFLFEEFINNYVGYPASNYIVGMLAVLLGYNTVTALFTGQHMVYLSGILSPIKTASRAGLQIAALYFGFELAGLFSGYIIGYFVVTVLGAIIVVRSFDKISIPNKYHYKNILSYAKFSWLGNLRAKAFNWIDIAVLGFFVSNEFVGYYTSAWNIAQFLIIFASSMSQSLFPEMSQADTNDSPKKISGLINDSLSYAGLFIIPGLIGGALLGEHILRIYGSEFTQARIILVILIIATLIQSYQNQITTTLNALDRPDLSFRINVVFIGANLILNLVLIYFYGWIGAAIATAASVAVSLLTAYLYLRSIIKFKIPTKEIARQILASIIMGICIFGLLYVEHNYASIDSNILLVFSLVNIGAFVYFATLIIVSPKFKRTVVNNLPVQLD